MRSAPFVLALLIVSGLIAGCVGAPAETSGIDDRPVVTPTVEPPAPAPAAAFVVESVRLADEEIAIGESASATIAVSNAGNAAGEATVLLLLADSVLGQERVTLGAGASRTFTFDFTPKRAGSHELVADVPGHASESAFLTVLAPALGGITMRDARDACEALPILVTFWNTGNAPALNVTVTLDLLDFPTGTVRDTREANAGDVAAGSSATVSLEFTKATRCRFEDLHQVRATVTPAFGDKAKLTSDEF